MAVIGLLLHLLLVIHSFCSLLSPCQATHHYKDDHYKYPFVKRASTFSSNVLDIGFDYIVVGGGTAGCPLATTLSQNYKVLLLERGGVPFFNSNVSLLRNFHLTLADISSTSASQYFISTDGVLNSRARILGGATSINAGFYTRASSRFIRKMGWDQKLANDSYGWIERQIVHMPKLVPWQKALRDSLLALGVSPYNGFTYDHLYGTKVGGTIYDRFGRRHTSAELLVSANPHNLMVLVHATVQRLLFDASSLGKQPKAIGVIFKDENGNKHRAFLKNSRASEVILSCGAIGTPQMLKLSGIGPKSELDQLNISVVVDSEFVGKGMADNPMNSIFIPTDKPIQQSLIQTVGITKRGVYIEASSGFGQSTDSIKCHHGILSAEIGQLCTIPPKERTLAAIQDYIRRKKDLPYELFRGGFILEKIAYPISRGELTLVSTNVDENPSVTFNYFSHPHDLQQCVEGVRMAAKIVQSQYYANYSHWDSKSMEMILNMSISASVNLVPKQINDTKSVEQFCKDTVITIWHYHGGCHVGKVVRDGDYMVLGVERVRVVDGSLFDESPGTNPQATVLMMGRYMGLKILRDRQ